MIPAELKKILAFGSGVGIQIAGPRGAESLHIAAARVRPNGARVIGTLVIEDFRRQPAGVWGATYNEFLRKHSISHAVAVVLLPRTDVILRPLTLAGVSNKDLDNAVRFQMDGLHPYGEDDVYSSWARLPGSSTVLVGVARREIVERYEAVFAEAGVRVRGFTCSAVAIYSALRLFGAKPAAELLVRANPEDDPSGSVEFYGESPARAVFSASFDASNQRAASLAAAELRINLESAPKSAPESAPSAERPALSKLLGAEPALPFAAALSSACPGLCLSLNLLPPERRQASSRLRWVPSIALGLAVLALVAMLLGYSSWQSRRYLDSLDRQIAAIAPQVARAGAVDKQISVIEQRIQMLDDLRRQPKADMDVLAQLTTVLAPPTWVNLMQITPKQVVIGGEAPEAAPLLSLLDGTPFFVGSEFQSSPTRVPGGEQFRIKTNREGGR